MVIGICNSKVHSPLKHEWNLVEACFSYSHLILQVSGHCVIKNLVVLKH